MKGGLELVIMFERAAILVCPRLILHVPGMNGPNTAGVTGAESPLPRSPLVFGPFMPGTCNSSRSNESIDTIRSSIQLRYPHRVHNLAIPMVVNSLSSNPSRCNLSIVFINGRTKRIDFASSQYLPQTSDQASNSVSGYSSGDGSLSPRSSIPASRAEGDPREHHLHSSE